MYTLLVSINVSPTHIDRNGRQYGNFFFAFFVRERLFSLTPLKLQFAYCILDRLQSFAKCPTLLQLHECCRLLVLSVVSTLSGIRDVDAVQLADFI